MTDPDLSVVPSSVPGSVPDPALVGLLRDRVRALMPAARDDLAALVAMPSVFDPDHPAPPACQQAAQWVLDAVLAAGLTSGELVATDDGSTAVVARFPAPPGAPTVLLYSHYDVQPAPGELGWHSPPFTLTERDGRWYGRGAADCKGNIVAHLIALRALAELEKTRADAGASGGPRFPVGIVFVSEGSEEQGTGGLERLVEARPDLLRADTIVVADAGNAAVGVPTLTTSLRGMANVRVSVEALRGELHSGVYGGAAPDALAALIAMLASLRDARGNTTIDGLDSSGRWAGLDLPEEQFRADAGVLEEVELVGEGSLADRLWARPAVTVLGIDAPPVVGSAVAIQPRARARINLRVPPGMDAVTAAETLMAHLRRAAPWGVRVSTEIEASGAPFRAKTDGPAYAAMSTALLAAFGPDVQGGQVALQGMGGSIPLCTVLQATYPDAEIMLIGVEEPRCSIHAADESVDPSEIERIALAEAVFLAGYRAGYGAGYRAG